MSREELYLITETIEYELLAESEEDALERGAELGGELDSDCKLVDCKRYARRLSP